MRRITRPVKAGNITIGGKAPVSVQSMTKTDTRDAAATIAQIKELQSAGCEIIRCAVLDEEAAGRIKQIKACIKIPLVADIHFNSRLAVLAIEAGADKIRINPGNIGSDLKVKEIIAAAKSARIPIRIGVNAGSLEKYSGKQRNESAAETAKKMVKKAVSFIRFFERNKFEDIVLSLKASDTLTTIEAYTKMAKECDYPFHVGVTEAGTVSGGTIKSAVGIGVLLHSGIGDTIRVSLAGNPLEEIRVGCGILKTLRLRDKGVDLIVCPTCGRCGVNLFALSEKVEKLVAGIEKSVKIAVMGCVVNGPGEASEADLGIACGKGMGMLFKNGKVIKRVKEEKLVEELMKEINKLKS